MKKLVSTLLVLLFCVPIFAQNISLSDYTGTYIFDEDAPFEWIEITLEGDELIAEAEMMGSGELYATDEKDEFGEPTYQALLRFIRNDKGVVTEVEVSAQGMTLYGVRQGADIDLNDYSGTYVFSEDDPFEYIEILVDGEDLIAEADGLGAGEIYPTDEEDEFGEPTYQALLKFIRDASGNVNKLQVSAQGMIMMGVKEQAGGSEYAGEYVLQENEYLDYLNISFTNGVLSVETSIGNSDLAATSEQDVFDLKSVDGKLGFDRDDSGKVVGLKVMAMGVLFEAQKKVK